MIFLNGGYKMTRNLTTILEKNRNSDRSTRRFTRITAVMLAFGSSLYLSCGDENGSSRACSDSQDCIDACQDKAQSGTDFDACTNRYRWQCTEVCEEPTREPVSPGDRFLRSSISAYRDYDTGPKLVCTYHCESNPK